MGKNARGSSVFRGRLASGAVLALALLATLAPSASAADDPVMPTGASDEVSGYVDTFGVSVATAEENLATQDRAMETNVVGEVETDLGDSFGGVWFNNATGDYVVAVTGANSAPARSAFAEAGLGNEVRTVKVESTWADLEAEQERIDSELLKQIEAGFVRTSLNPAGNSVELKVVSGAPDSVVTEAAEVARGSEVDVDLRQNFDALPPMRPMSCNGAGFLLRYCDSPLRGGVGIADEKEESVRDCTSAFRARGDSNGKRYLLTAGHCAQVGETWWSYDAGMKNRVIGTAEQSIFPIHDWAKINATGSEWDVTPWPARIVLWKDSPAGVLDESYAIYGEADTVMWQTVCHSGTTTATSCGVVTSANETVVYEGEGTLYNLNIVEGGCVGGGDSGGSVYANHMALGMLSGGGVNEAGGEEHYCTDAVWAYNDIEEATDNLNAHIAWPSSATAVSHPSNGAPGSVYATGKVTSAGGPKGNVQVNFSKKEGGTWTFKQGYETALQPDGTFTTPTLTAGVGSWRVKTVVPPLEYVEPSESTYDEFEIKPGGCKTTTYLTPGTVINGQPGFINLAGTVQTANPECGTVNGQYVNINYSKWNGSKYVYQETDQPTVVNGAYSMTNRILGGGKWSIKTVFLGQAWFAGSESGEHIRSIENNGWHIDNLGGTTNADPDISSRVPGALDVFIRGVDNQLWIKSCCGGGWGGWIPMGGALSGGPGAVSWDGVRIDVVANSGGTVAHWYWTGSAWGADNLGGGINSDVDISSWAPNRLDVFARSAANNHLLHKYWAGAGWSGWEDMGGNLAGGPSAVSWSSGRIDVVARMADNTIGHWYWANGWFYDNLGGTLTSDPDISSQDAGKLDIFARGTEAGLWHKWYTTSYGKWSNWEPMGGSLAGGPGAVSWANNRVDVVARNWDNTVTHWWYSP